MSEEEPTLGDVLEASNASTEGKRAGPLYGEVTAYDHTTQSVDVQPLVKIPVEGRMVVAPVLRGLRVIWPGGGIGGNGGALTFPLAAGDVGQLIPQAADLSNWIASETKHQDPATEKNYQLHMSSFLPLLRPFSSPLASALVHATSPVLSGDPVLLGDSTADQFVARDTDTVHKTNTPTPDLMSAWMAQVESAINILAPGSISPLSTTFTQVGAIQSTATKVKAK